MKRSNFIKRTTLATIGISLFPSIAFSDNSYEAYLRWFKEEFKHFKYNPIHPDTTYHSIKLSDSMRAFRRDSKVIVDFLEKGIKPYDEWYTQLEDNDGNYSTYAQILMDDKEYVLPIHKKLIEDYKIITFEEWKNKK